MISKGSVLKVIDNSGARIVKCIHIYGVSGRNYAVAGDLILVTVRQVNPEKKIKKSMLYKAVVARVKKPVIRDGGEKVRFDENGVVIMRDHETPLGTWILGPVLVELRKWGFMKVISLARVTF